MDQLTAKTLEVTKAAQLAKAGFSVATGLVGYSLEAPSQLIFPVLTPLRNTIPRFGSQTPMVGVQPNWKTITGINTANVSVGVQEGKRGGVLSITEVDRSAPYKGIGIENTVSFEADYASEGFEDVRATAALINLQSLMLQEENIILNGDATLALGTTPTPVTPTPVVGGSITATATCKIACVALTYDGYIRATIAGGVPLSVTRTNADATTTAFGGGSAIGSAMSAAATTSGGNLSLSTTVAAVKGAFAYAWYLTTDGTAANCLLAAITTVPAVTLTANAAGTQAITAVVADNSVNALVFDGLISVALSLGGYYKSLANGKLTKDGVGGVVEIDTALRAFWDLFRISPSKMLVGAQVKQDINAAMLTGTSSLIGYRQNFTETEKGSLKGGVVFGTYLNKFALNQNQDLEIVLHPNMPANTIFFDLDVIPQNYQNGRIPMARRIRTRREYYQIDWPLRTRTWEMGVYADEVLQVYLALGMGVIQDIAPGLN